MPILNKLLDKIKNNEQVLLMFDYDGTLTPIVEKPDLAGLNEKTKNNLETITGINNIRIAIITGRKITDIQKISNIKHPLIAIYGIHGGEVLPYGKTSPQINISENIVLKLQEFKKILEKSIITEFKSSQGIIIEDKRFSISLHYRLSDNLTAQKAIEIFDKYTQQLNMQDDFRIQKGKKVIELLPLNFSKNTAVNSLILENPNHYPVYFGDDLTDICAFKEVKNYNGYAIGVGEAHPDYIELIDQQIQISELYDFLEEIKSFFKYNN